MAIRRVALVMLFAVLICWKILDAGVLTNNGSQITPTKPNQVTSIGSPTAKPVTPIKCDTVIYKYDPTGGINELQQGNCPIPAIPKPPKWVTAVEPAKR